LVTGSVFSGEGVAATFTITRIHLEFDRIPDFGVISNPDISEIFIPLIRHLE